MYEVLYWGFQAPINTEHLDIHREQIQPNLPWADDHFLERVGGEPLNPGEQWKHWPWSRSADGHRDSNGQFNHTYMERFWPKFAGLTADGGLPQEPGMSYTITSHLGPRHGIRAPLGDLNDLIELMLRDPLTRQAYLPIYFPEDTGLDGRKPCTLGYLFLMRNNRLDVTYYIRSCDYVRHFRDDVYLTVRLLLWVLEQLRERSVDTPSYDAWKTVHPGDMRMDVGSLHMFVNDWHKEFGSRPDVPVRVERA